MGNKYNARKTTVDGIEFDSYKEAKRYAELTYLEQAGHIKDLKMQVKYVLVPAQYEPDTVGPRGGTKKGKLIEKELAYVADFVYTDTETGEEVVEDIKGCRATDTGAYRVFTIKRKLMLYLKGIRITEI